MQVSGGLGGAEGGPALAEAGAEQLTCAVAPGAGAHQLGSSSTKLGREPCPVPEGAGQGLLLGPRAGQEQPALHTPCPGRGAPLTLSTISLTVAASDSK